MNTIADNLQVHPPTVIRAQSRDPAAKPLRQLQRDPSAHARDDVNPAQSRLAAR